jgi:hypothetical protein
VSGAKIAADQFKPSLPAEWGAPAGAAAGGFNLAGGALGGIGALAGNRDLANAGGAIGGIPAAATVASAAGLGGDAMSALSANPYTAAVAAAINQVMDMYGHLDRGAGGLNTFLSGLVAPIPVVGGIASQKIDEAFAPSEAYRSFPERAGETAQLENMSLRALHRGLPYVQSREELQNTMDAYNRAVGMRVGGYGQGAQPFQIDALPEIGARTHETHTNPTDFAAITPEVQKEIDALLPRLPDKYTGTDTSDPLMRTFTQHLDRRQSAPHEILTNDPTTLDMYAKYPGQFNEQRVFDSGQPYDPSWYSTTGAKGPQERHVQYGDPGYNYAGSSYPGQGENVGQYSQYWTDLTGQHTPDNHPVAAQPIDWSATGSGSSNFPFSAPLGSNEPVGGGDGGGAGDGGGGAGAGAGAGAGSGDGGDGGMRKGGQVRTRRQRPSAQALIAKLAESQRLKSGATVELGDPRSQSDDVPVRLEKNEIVMNRPAAAAHAKQLDEWNRQGRKQMDRSMGGFAIRGPGR